MPMPSSSTTIHTRSGRRPARMRIWPPSGVYLIALDTIFIITCIIRSRSAVTSGRPGSRSSSRWWLWRWASIYTALYRSWTASPKGKRLSFSSERSESKRERVSRSWTIWVMRSLSLRMTVRNFFSMAGGISPAPSARVSA